MIAARFASRIQDVDDLADLLILEQPAHEIGARVFPRFVALRVREQQLGFDAQQPRGHVEIIGRLVETERVQTHEELLGDARDRNVVNVDLLVANERQQEVQRPVEVRELHDEWCALGDHSVKVMAHLDMRDWGRQL